MAGSFSNFAENELLDHLFSAATYTAPATVYIALYSAAPSDAGGGTELTSGTAPGYARASVTNNATNWPAASGGAKSNGTEISFAQATAAWPTVVGFGIFDALTTGNLLAWGDLLTSKTLASGDVAKFAVGDLDITLD